MCAVALSDGLRLDVSGGFLDGRIIVRAAGVDGHGHIVIGDSFEECREMIDWLENRFGNATPEELRKEVRS